MNDRLSILIAYNVSDDAYEPNRRTKTVYEIVDFGIESVGAEEAPLAVRWDDLPEDWQNPAWGRHERNGNGHTRWFNGSHWTPVLGTLMSGLHGPADETPLSELSSISRSWNPYRAFLRNVPTAASASRNPKVRLERPDPNTTIIGDSRTRKIKEVSAAVEKLLVVEGVVYQSCPEPRLVLVSAPASTMTPAVKECIRVIVDEEEIAKAIEDGLHKCAPVTGFDDMNDLCHLFGTAVTQQANLKRRPEILEPASLDHDTWLDQCALSMATKFIATYSRMATGSLSTKQLMSMVKIRDAVDTRDRDDRLELLEDALGMCVQYWPEFSGRDEMEKLAQDLGAREIGIPFPATDRGMKP